MFQIHQDAELGEIKLISSPIKLSETPGTIRKLAPNSGEHTNEILSEVGYSDKQIEDLISHGIIKN